MKAIYHSDECRQQFRNAPTAKAMSALKCICGGTPITIEDDPSEAELIALQRECELGTELANE